MLMDKSGRIYKSRQSSGFGRHRSRDEDVDAEQGLIPLSERRYTFSYEVAENNNALDKRPRFVSAQPTSLVSTFDYSTAFEFAPEINFAGEKSSKSKTKKSKKLADDLDPSTEDIPTNYQSIFTYDSIFHGDESKYVEDLETDREPTISGGTYATLVSLSFLFVLFTLPISVWFCIKKLSKSKRMIVFRLGRKLKQRGPGLTMILPFVDEWRIFDIDEQSVVVKPLSADTADGGQIEMGCTVVFHIVDPEMAVTFWSRDPHDLVLKRVQTALSAAIGRNGWHDLTSGHALPDVCNDVRGSTNSFSSTCGIQIVEVKVTEAKSTRDPPTAKDEIASIDFRKLGKQIAQLSPLLISGASENGMTKTQMASAQFTTMIDQLTASSRPRNESVAAAAATAEGEESETKGPTPPAVTATMSEKAIEELVERALSRSQVFLGNERARAALGRDSLQVFVYATDVQRETEHVAAFYMDAEDGKSSRGILGLKKPSSTVHINAIHLAETLEGRLDLLEAMKRSQIRFSGSLIALSKLRFLLQFK